jgi:hypothetical protein
MITSPSRTAFLRLAPKASLALGNCACRSGWRCAAARIAADVRVQLMRRMQHMKYCEASCGGPRIRIKDGRKFSVDLR